MAVERKRMRTVRILTASSLAFVMLASSSQAQTGNWNTVKDLPPSTHISVKAQRNYNCIFEGATDDQLVCEVHKRRSFRTIVVNIPRAEIREVRMLRTHTSQAKSAAIGAGVGAGAGAVLAGSTSKASPGANAFFGALGGAFFGAFVGMFVPVIQIAIHPQSKVVYKQ